MGPGLGMDGEDVRPRLGEGLEEGIDRRDHEMDVERLGAVRPERLHHRRADGQIGHEMAVHDVDVDPVRSRLVDGAHLLAEPGEVGREDGGGDADGLLHARTLTLPESRGKERARLIPALLGMSPRRHAPGLHSPRPASAGNFVRTKIAKAQRGRRFRSRAAPCPPIDEGRCGLRRRSFFVPL